MPLLTLLPKPGLSHAEESHGEVTFQVARGVFSTVDGRRFAIGGRWILDEVESREALDQIAALEAKGQSFVCVVVGQKLAGVIAFDDPLRSDVVTTLARLRKLGIGRLTLITGDESRVAERIGVDLGLTEIYGDIFPEQKVALIRMLQAGGSTVAMVGDGINDRLALSGADVGVSVANATNLSQETADVLLLRPGLAGSIDAVSVSVSRVTIARAKRTFRQVEDGTLSAVGFGLSGETAHPPARPCFITWARFFSRCVPSIPGSARRLNRRASNCARVHGAC